MGANFMLTTRLLGVLLSVICLSAAQETITYVTHYLESFPGPQVYKDPHGTTTLYLETDGRHVAAISGDGKLLWNKDPFKDQHLPFYRTKNPQIIYIGPVSKARPYAAPYAGSEPDSFVAITFNNSQFGLLRISNGEFKFLGND
jgi:hypothetical protein